MFYDNLKAACEKQGVKVTPIVIECGGTSSSGAAWKKGAMPRGDILLKLARRLNVSTDYLLGNTQPPNISTGDVNNSIVGSINSAVNIGVELNDVEREIIKVCKGLELKEQVKVLQFAYDVQEKKEE